MMHDHNDDIAIGRRVTEARLLAGLTQQALADRLQWPVSTLGNYESGRRALRVTHLIMIAQALGRPAAAFLATDPAEETIIERLARHPERSKQVVLFLNSLDTDDLPQS